MDKIRQGFGLSALVAALSYAALWLAYSQFYQRVGLTPEDVGIDKVDLLSQALVGPAVLFAVLLVTYGFILVTVVVATILNLREAAAAIPELYDMLRGRPGPTVPPPPRRPLRERAFIARAEIRSRLRRERRSARWVCAGVATLTFCVICGELFTRAGDLGREVVDGRAVSRPYFTVRGVAIPLLDIRATPVDVTWTGGEATRPWFEGEDLETECLLYLGESGGTTLVFSPTSRSLHRLASADVALRLEPVDTQDERCFE